MFPNFIQKIKSMLSHDVEARSTGDAISMTYHGGMESRDFPNHRSPLDHICRKLADKFWASAFLVSYPMLLLFGIVLWAVHPWEPIPTPASTAASTLPGMAIAVPAQIKPVQTIIVTEQATVTVWKDPATSTTTTSASKLLTTAENAQSTLSTDYVPAPATSSVSSAIEQVGQTDSPAYCSWKGDLWTLCGSKPTSTATSQASALKAYGIIKRLGCIRTRLSSFVAVIIFNELSVAEGRTTGTLSESVAVVGAFFLRFFAVTFVLSVIVQLWVGIKDENRVKYEIEIAEYDKKVPTDTYQPGDKGDGYDNI